MGHFVLGFKALFRVWTDDAFALQVGRWLESGPVHPAPAATPARPAPSVQAAAPLPRFPRMQPSAGTPASRPSTEIPAPAAPRNEALSLLAVLQRDAHLLDFLKKPTVGFSDAEIGATARLVHREAGAVIERIFGIEPITKQVEGATVEVPTGYDPARLRIVGDFRGDAGPWRGILTHPGWKAVRADVPAWTSQGDAASVLAPVEVEI